MAALLRWSRSSRWPSKASSSDRGVALIMLGALFRMLACSLRPVLNLLGCGYAFGHLMVSKDFAMTGWPLRGTYMGSTDPQVQVARQRFPGRRKFLLNLLHISSLILGLQALQKAKKQAWISWVLFQVSPKHCFGSVRLALSSNAAPRDSRTV